MSNMLDKHMTKIFDKCWTNIFDALDSQWDGATCADSVALSQGSRSAREQLHVTLITVDAVGCLAGELRHDAQPLEQFHRRVRCRKTGVQLLPRLLHGE